MRIKRRGGLGHALVQGKTPGNKPLPECQCQAQQGEGAENQVQDHCLLCVVVRAIVIEPARGRKWKSEARKLKETRRPKSERRGGEWIESSFGRWGLNEKRIVWQALGRPKGELAPPKRRNPFGRITKQYTHGPKIL